MRIRFVVALTTGSALGISLPFITPDHWWNLAYMPLYTGWFTMPADLLFIRVCNVLHVDWLSDAADRTKLSILQAACSGITAAIYTSVLYAIYRLVRKLGQVRLSGRDSRATKESAS